MSDRTRRRLPEAPDPNGGSLLQIVHFREQSFRSCVCIGISLQRISAREKSPQDSPASASTFSVSFQFFLYSLMSEFCRFRDSCYVLSMPVSRFRFGFVSSLLLVYNRKHRDNTDGVKMTI
jgi:hypothetical protein